MGRVWKVGSELGKQVATGIRNIIYLKMKSQASTVCHKELTSFNEHDALYVTK